MTTTRMGACPICQDPMMRCLAPFDYGWVNHALTSSRNCPLFGKTSSAEWAKRTGHHYPYDEEQIVAAPPISPAQAEDSAHEAAMSKETT